MSSSLEVKVKTLNKEEIKKQILNLTCPYLKHIMGIYLVGSYARNEEKADSDVDVVIISNKNIKLRIENYHLICLKYDDLLKEMEESVIEYYPMLLEAETILNENLLQNLLKMPVMKKNLKWHLDSTKSALNIIKKALQTEDKDLIVNDAIIYSLILRLREIYLADCILEGKIGSIKDFIKYSEKIKSIEKLYNIYRKLKNDKKAEIKANINEIEECYEVANNKLKNQEKKINGLK